MPLHINDNGIAFGHHVIHFNEFNNLYNGHLDRVHGTLELEATGAYLLNANLIQIGELVLFIREICRWGGYPGVAGRIIINNDHQFLIETFGEAINALHHGAPPGVVMQIINGIHSLGRPSFASKHLRFLHPATCPVLDRILVQNLHYQNNPNGYQQFADDCIFISIQLNQLLGNHNGVPWRAADVEMSIFQYIWAHN